MKSSANYGIIGCSVLAHIHALHFISDDILNNTISASNKQLNMMKQGLECKHSFKSFCLPGENLLPHAPAHHNLFIKVPYLIISINQRCVFR